MSYGVLCYADSLNHDELIGFARNAEAAGLDAIWLPELTGREPFVTSGTVLGATSSIRVGTAIANMYVRDAVVTKAAACSLADGYGDRFDLGLGLSNKVLNVPRGHPWLPPLEKLEDFMDRFDAAKLGFATGCAVNRYLAAHGPKLLQFAAARMDGAFSYLQTVDYSAEAKNVLGAKRLNLMLPTVFMDDPQAARNVARKVIAVYTKLENYHRAWRARGFNDADFIDGGSDDFVDAIVAWGDRERIADRLAAHHDHGVDHIVMMPVMVDLKRDAGWEQIAGLIG